MKTKISIGQITQKLLFLQERFLISICLIAGLAFLLLGVINNSQNNVELPFQFLVFFLIGALISVTATLWLENRVNYPKQRIVTLIVVVLWGVYCFFLPKDFDDVSISKGIEVAVIGVSAFLSMFFISFLKKDKDIAFWNFTILAVSVLCMVVFLGVIIYGGLALATHAIDQLFVVRISSEVYSNLAVICFVLFVPLCFLANIPDKIAKHNETITLQEKYWKILVLYILTPLAAIYTCILYIYLFKILITWELPNGGVSWLMSILALGGLLIITLLYPSRLQKENKLLDFLSRYFGLIILPLLVLMTIGIFYRIGEYGMTIKRGYILLLNIWFYGIYAYLFITKSQRIKWIFLSATLVALLTSIGFWSVSSITKYTLTAELNKLLNYQKITLSDKTLFDEMELKTKEKIKDKLTYLDHTYGRESFRSFFADTIQNEESIYKIFDKLDIDNGKKDVEDFSIYKSFNNSVHALNNDFNTLIVVAYRDYNKNTSEKINYAYKKGEFLINVVSENRVFSIPLKKIVKEYFEIPDNEKKMEYILCSDDYTFVIVSFYGSYEKETDVISINGLEGYLFYNRIK